MGEWEILDDFLKENDIFIDDGKWEKLLHYLKLVEKWGDKISLVSRRDLKGGLLKHIADSLILIKYIPSFTSIADLGSGAGFLGIPLKIALEEPEVFLVESKRKKSLFLKAVIRELNLKGISILSARWEDVHLSVDVAVAKATGDFESLYQNIDHLVKRDGQFVYYSTIPLKEPPPFRVIQIKSPLREVPFYLNIFRRE